MDHEKIKSILETNLQGSEVILSNSDCNLTLTIVSDKFIGQTLLNRHKEVLSHLKEMFLLGGASCVKYKDFNQRGVQSWKNLRSLVAQD